MCDGFVVQLHPYNAYLHHSLTLPMSKEYQEVCTIPDNPLYLAERVPVKRDLYRFLPFSLFPLPISFPFLTSPHIL